MSFASSEALSGGLKALADNPLLFLTKNAIEFAPVSVPAEYRSHDGLSFRSGKAMIKLELRESPTVRRSYNLQFIPQKDLPTHTSAADVFVLGYRQNGDVDVPYVDIPIQAYSKNTFLFTAGLTGCSVIVTRWNKDTYRVFHDRRMDSAVLYNYAEMYVNFNDYRIGGPVRYLSHTGSAITFMVFQDGEWKMFLQRLLPSSDTSKSTWKPVAHEVQRNSLSTKELEKIFNDRRDILQRRVKSTGSRLHVGKNFTDGAVDGIVEGVEYNEKAIAGWMDLRSAIKSKIDAYHGDQQRDRRLEDTYNRFADDISDLEQIDETWIWLQINKRRRA